MKCPVCKYLNVREEARKHLNTTTILTLASVTKELQTLEQAIIGVVASKCSMHNDSKVLTAHLRDIGKFAGELKTCIDVNGSNNAFQKLFNCFPDPRKS